MEKGLEKKRTSDRKEEAIALHEETKKGGGHDGKLVCESENGA